MMSHSPFAQLVAASTGEDMPVPKHLMAPSSKQSSKFSEADLSLIRKVHRHMPPRQLLDLLNARLEGDRGPFVTAFTMEQLNAEVRKLGIGETGKGRDWPGLRRLLASARAAGVLKLIDEQVIDDFAIVFQLNAKQVLELKDVVLSAQQE